MKYGKKHLRTILALGLAVVTLAGCGGKKEDASADGAFDYSALIDENGHWKDIKAADYVTSFDYKQIEVPADTHTVKEEDLQTQIDSLVSQYDTVNEITDREVKDGDTLNIDYVGSVDGVEFENGSTNGQGATVTIGETNFIDGFLPQLVGHKPGESFDINVTFPDPYENNPDLAGKDAVFAITINHIEETVPAVVTDEFVKEKFAEQYGWNTIEEMKKGLSDQLQKNAIRGYIQNYMVENAAFSSVPEDVINYQADVAEQYYILMASQYGMEVNDLLSTMGVESFDQLKEQNKEDNEKSAKFYLAAQYVAEQENIEATDDETKEMVGAESFDQYEEMYGMPYMKLNALVEKVVNFLIETAVLA